MRENRVQLGKQSIVLWFSNLIVIECKMYGVNFILDSTVFGYIMGFYRLNIIWIDEVNDFK